MAVVLDAFAAKLAGILMGMAKEEVEMLLGVPGEITKLETTLGDLSAIMADAEVARIRSNAVERWVRELKDAMYDADDILDLCQIMEAGSVKEDAMSAPSRTASSRCFSTTQPMAMFSCFRKPVATHEIGRKIKALNKRLRDIAERSFRFGFIVRELNSSLVHSTNGTASSDSNRKTGPSTIVRSGVVGDKVERDMQDIVALLLQEVDAASHGTSSGNVVVSAAITGAGGIGKTTLARMVFNNGKVEQNFDKRIWLSINNEVDQISVLRCVIAAVGGGSYGGGGTVGDRPLLECALKQAVRRKKLLVVMDDVWSEDVWSDLLSAPLADAVAPGSRVLVTTRNDEVAHRMKARHLHRVGKLEDDDAWVLLKKQVISDEIDELEVDGLLKDIGMKIVEKCEGLPLAIKVLGGHLFQISKTRDAWARVRDHFAWSISGNDDDINKAVYLSYEELPPDLKQCFVYCSLFPNNEPIRREEIINLWISEGYVNNKTTVSKLFDLGLKHYRELVSRNLLEPKYSYGQSECTMHDIIRSFAQYITKYEGLLVGEGQDSNLVLAAAPNIRHLSISNQVVEPGILRKQVSLRTLMLFGSTVVNSKELWSNLSSCLRVLYLDNVNLDELPDSICHLKHLRCLSLCATSISTIPEVIGDLQFLQGIDIFKCSNITQLPSSILKLRKLRLLNIRGTKITSVPRGFGKLRDLVIMAGFPTNSDDDVEGWCSLEELGPLTKLRYLDIIGLEKAPSDSVAARAKLCSKEDLKELHMRFASQLGDNAEFKQGNISREEQDRAEQVLGNLCPPTCIEQLVIKGYYGSDLPQWAKMMSALFSSLRRLTLEGYACCDQLPNGLGQLPFLEHLWVEQAPAIQCIGHGFLLSSSSDGQDDAVAGVATDLIMSRQLPASLISGGTGFAFPKLRRLGFEGMSGWTEWEWEQHIPAMPILEGFLIDGCKLHHLPPGLSSHATQLTLLDLRNVLNLVTIENFPSVTELKLWDNPRLEGISSCPRLHKITICSCPVLKLLELPALRTALWMDLGTETLPTYLQEVELSKLNMYCKPSLLKLISLQYDTPEWGKVQHVQCMIACGLEAPEDWMKADGVKGLINYTKEPYSFYAHLF